MRRRFFSRIVFVLLLMLLVAHSVWAQPQAWVPHRPYVGVTGFRSVLNVVDLGSGALQRFDLGSTEIGSGALSPDGRFYYLATALGVAKINTTSRTFAGLIGPPVHARSVEVSPSGDWLYVRTSSSRLLMIDVSTGLVVEDRSAPSALVLSPDGTLRFEINIQATPAQTTIAAYQNAPGAVLQWQRVVGSRVGDVVVGSADVVVDLDDGTSSEVLVLSAATGAEQARIDVSAVSALAIHSRTLLVSRRGPQSSLSYPQPWELVRVDLSTLTTIVLGERVAYGFTGPRRLIVSSDGSVVFWLYHTSILGLTVSNTSYTSYDVATGQEVGSGYLNYQEAGDIDVEPGEPCVFGRPSGLSVPAEGSVVEVPITTRGPCRPWSVTSPNLVNPGPHVGDATLRFIVSPTLYATTQQVSLPAPGGTVSVEQAGALPSAPQATAALTDGRVTLAWTPSVGAAHHSFLVRGALRGGAMMPLATLGTDARTWTSEPLLPGSYVLQVAAANHGGPGPYSNAIEFSIGVSTTPDAPTNLETTSADGVAMLRWVPPLTGPAPSGYDIEAAPAGSPSFATIARAFMSTYAATRVPVGVWDVRVRAVTAGGRSAPSNTVRLTVAACTAAPGAPTVLQAVATTTPTRSARLHWRAPASGGAEDYVIELGSSSGTSNLGRVFSPGSGLVFEASVPSGFYFARVRARNACGEGAPSNEAAVYVP